MGWCQIRRKLSRKICQRRAKLQYESAVEGVETRRHPPKFRNEYGEGIVQGVVKATQTGILWSQVQVLVGPPVVKTPISNVGGFVFFEIGRAHV